MPQRRSSSYSRPEHSSGDSRSHSYGPSPHRLPAGRHMSYSRSRSPRRGRRYNSRSRSRSRGKSRSRSLIRRSKYSPGRSPRKKRRRARESERRRHHAGSRSPSRDPYRRSRSRSRKPLERGSREAARGSINHGWSPRKAITMKGPPKTPSPMYISTTGAHYGSEPGEVSPPQARALSRLSIPSGSKALPFASAANLGDLIKSSLISGANDVMAAGGKPDLSPTDVLAAMPPDLEKDVEHPRPTNRSPIMSMAPDVAEVRPVACQPSSYTNPDQYPTLSFHNPNGMHHTPRSPSRDPRLTRMAQQDVKNGPPHPTPGVSPSRNPKDLHESLQELAQAIASMVKFKVDPELQGHPHAEGREIAQAHTKYGFQVYADSATRRSERVVASIANEVMSQVTANCATGSSRMQDTEKNCGRCDQLEQRIRVLEQQKLDPAALMAHLEKMETRVEQMNEVYLRNQCKKEDSEEGPPLKRRRLGASPVSPSPSPSKGTLVNQNEVRLRNLENTVLMWERRLAETLGMGEQTAAGAEERPKPIVDRLNSLEEDAQQVFGYLSVHHTALVALNSALSLDPSKPLGQVFHRQLTDLRVEMAHMLTDAFGSLEDSLARVIVGVIIKQTKLEMQATCESVAKELREKLISDPQVAKGQEPVWLPDVKSGAHASGSGPLPRQQSIAPEFVLPAIWEFPSMKE